LAGGRAALQSAALSFTAGKFADAQTQFQKYLDAHSDGSFAAVAALGVAASLDAQGKADLAITAYQKVISFSSTGSEVSSAKFALGRISEAQGKLSEAEKYFEDVARSNPNSSLGSEAGLRAMELKSKLPATIKS
jgi:TolA-binding protein